MYSSNWADVPRTRSTDALDVNRGRFRELVERLVGREFPKAHVTVVFNDELHEDDIDVGETDVAHQITVRGLVAAAWLRATRASYPELPRN
jgi:hypothetical protein